MIDLAKVIENHGRDQSDDALILAGFLDSVLEARRVSNER